MNTRDIGKFCEDEVSDYLTDHGYFIKAQNFQYGRSSEIDIIASRNGVLHFIEVKARSSDKYGLPREALSSNKIFKIRRASELYMKFTNTHDIELSYDVAEVYFKKNNETIEISSIELLVGVF